MTVARKFSNIESKFVYRSYFLIAFYNFDIDCYVYYNDSYIINVAVSISTNSRWQKGGPTMSL